MTDFIINNQITLRGCILYEFTRGNKPFKTYQKLMKTLGDDSMTYPEFEFWFMRFARGNFDLDYDFSLEPKKRKITDLPVEIFEKVGDSLDFVDRVNLRVVSKDIQFLVDNWNPKVSDFTYYGFDYWTIVQNSKIYRFESWKRPDSDKPLPIVVRILKNRKLRLQKLTVYPNANWEIVEEELRKSSTKLHVSHLTVENSDYPIDIRLLAPESLEEVSLFINEKSVKKFNEILHSEQCKQLKMLTISTDLSPSNFPFESFIGYPRFTIMFKYPNSGVDVAEFIKKLIKCAQLKSCKLDCGFYDDKPNWESIKELLSEKDTMVPDCPNIRRYPIQGSTDFYEINIGKNCVSVERKS
ncbi:hypothetical protein CRE_25935 [Caenorhabditis remanei]|uniref:F-box domain-containing protein n=1 Tax=Caenorhabditis remanei TaxID=31234 RepID=E3NK09_CAERE|nr:hypothetical protein CRE_25935 [Caenorhabditis remanei]